MGRVRELSRGSTENANRFNFVRRNDVRFRPAIEGKPHLNSAHRATVGSTEMRVFATGFAKDATAGANEPSRDVVEVAASSVRTPCTVQPQSPRPVGQSNAKKKYLSPAAVPPCAPPGGIRR